MGEVPAAGTMEIVVSQRALEKKELGQVKRCPSWTELPSFAFRCAIVAQRALVVALTTAFAPLHAEQFDYSNPVAVPSNWQVEEYALRSRLVLTKSLQMEVPGRPEEREAHVVELVEREEAGPFGPSSSSA